MTASYPSLCPKSEIWGQLGQSSQNPCLESFELKSILSFPLTTGKACTKAMLQAPSWACLAYLDVEESTYMSSIWVKTEGFFALLLAIVLAYPAAWRDYARESLYNPSFFQGRKQIHCCWGGEHASKQIPFTPLERGLKCVEINGKLG